MTSKDTHYELDGRELIAQAEGLRVQVLTIGPGQCVPWHRHTQITDTFFCLRGPMIVQTSTPDRVHRLESGGRLAVPPGQPHRVAGLDDRGCQFVIVQGVGEYDYLPGA